MSSVRVCLLFPLLLVLITALLVSADEYQWAAWRRWTDCRVTCGPGWKTRSRKCMKGGRKRRWRNCSGKSRGITRCTLPSCPEYRWDPWGNWTVCSVTCGNGQRSRSRACVGKGTVVDSDRCEAGNDTETKNCTMPACPAGNGTDAEVSPKAEYQWDEWRNWTDCSVTCGNGQRSRSRACVSNGTKVDSDRCEDGKDTETAKCTMPVCPVEKETDTEVSSKAEYHWDEWGNWTLCSVTCGHGQRSRSRACVSNGTKVDSDRCEAGKDTETAKCMMPVCPVETKTDSEVSSKAEYHWDEWGNWTLCSVTCGNGQRSRSRACVSKGTKVDSDRCEAGKDTETAKCMMPVCPVETKTDSEVSSKAEYHWDEWGNWTICSVTCGNGQRSRSRACVSNGTKVDSDRCEAGKDTETAKCMMPVCPVETKTDSEVSSKAEYHWDEWGNWTHCSVTCGHGQRSRSRACVENGTKVDSDRCKVGNDAETKNCTMRPCTGPGIKNPSGTTSKPKEKKVQVYTWGAWEKWSVCNGTCGKTTKTRSRKCMNGGKAVDLHMELCAGNRTETQNCTLSGCPGQVSGAVSVLASTVTMVKATIVFVVISSLLWA